jgi:5-methylcytosine-specific restriction endonuclease McrA
VNLKETDPKVEEQIQKLYDEGFCDEEIADRIGKAKGTIGKWRAKRGLSTVFENRKRLTNWESRQIQEYLAFERKYKRITKEKTLTAHEKGLIAFVMSLTHQLSTVSQKDIEDYIIAHNTVHLTRRNELLTTSWVAKFSIPDIPVTRLFDFASRIIATRIFYRDKHCINCGSINPLHLHMLKGKFNLNDENLETLCENCYRITKR